MHKIKLNKTVAKRIVNRTHKMPSMMTMERNYEKAEKIIFFLISSIITILNVSRRGIRTTSY